MLNKKVLVQEITNLSDARYCAGMMVDFLSFPLNESIISPSTFKEIKQWVSGVEFYGEMGNYKNYQELASKYEIEKVIFQNEELVNNVKSPFALTLNINDDSILEKVNHYKNTADFIILNTPEILLETELSILKELKNVSNILIKGNFSLENFKIYSKDEDINGFVFLGSSEERPGYKDFEYLTNRLEYLEID